MYSYVCDHCGTDSYQDEFRPIGKLAHNATCPLCGGLLRRAAGLPAFKHGMEEHFNVAVGRPIHSDAQFRSELARKSDQMSEQTGMDHRYVPVDMRDRAANGVTDEGLDTTAKMKRDSGLTRSTKRIIT